MTPYETACYIVRMLPEADFMAYLEAVVRERLRVLPENRIKHLSVWGEYKFWMRQRLPEAVIHARYFELNNEKWAYFSPDKKQSDRIKEMQERLDAEHFMENTGTN